MVKASKRKITLLLARLLGPEPAGDRKTVYQFHPADEHRLLEALTGLTTVLCQSARLGS